MITIGIDPGIERVGIGIISQEKQSYKLIFKKLIKTSSKQSNADRIKNIFDELNTILESHKIDSASVEKLYFAKNVKTAMVVSEVRGVILLALRLKNIPIFEYTPLQVKQALVGYGRATKNQVQEFVKLMLGLDKVPDSDDVADALAIAIIHLNTYKTLSKIKMS